MVAEWDETCVWCASKTKSRCGKCAEAGIAIFFCSPDHQKLAWKTHRLVCGPGKANPFLWPLLSPEEASTAVQHMHEPARAPFITKPSIHTLAKALKEFAGVPDAELESAVNCVTKGTVSAASFADAEGGIQSQQRLLLVIRAQEGARTMPANPLERRGTSAMGTLNELADYDLVVARDKTGLTQASMQVEPWRTQFRHFLLARTAIMSNMRDPVGPFRAEKCAWLRNSLARNAKFVSDVVARTHPGIAAALLQEFAEMKELARTGVIDL